MTGTSPGITSSTEDLASAVGLQKGSELGLELDYHRVNSSTKRHQMNKNVTSLVEFEFGFDLSNHRVTSSTRELSLTVDRFHRSLVYKVGKVESILDYHKVTGFPRELAPAGSKSNTALALEK